MGDAGLLYSLIPRVPSGTAVIHLFGGPYLTVGGLRAEVPDGSKRLLTYVALSSGCVDRRLTAGNLWPDAYESRAAGNLRSALWRLRRAGLDVLECSKSTIALRGGTFVDVDLISRWAGRLIDGTAPPSELLSVDAIRELTDLLPGWYDDWVIFERERLRQKLLHALEALSRRLTLDGQYAQAIEAALAALAVDPLRESAARVLIEAHLAEGNLSEARRAYAQFCRTLQRELGVRPGVQLQSLMFPAPARRPVLAATR
jgi:DNA-binding SARP family transcriptional activator